jgi:hypothetical protein
MTHLSSGDDTGIVDRQEQGERERGPKAKLKGGKPKRAWAMNCHLVQET